MLNKISDKFIKKDLNYDPKPYSSSQSEKRSEKVFQNKKNDYYSLVAEDNIQVKFKD